MLKKNGSIYCAQSRFYRENLPGRKEGIGMGLFGMGTPDILFYLEIKRREQIRCTLDCYIRRRLVTMLH